MRHEAAKLLRSSWGYPRGRVEVKPPLSIAAGRLRKVSMAIAPLNLENGDMSEPPPPAARANTRDSGAPAAT